MPTKGVQSELIIKKSEPLTKFGINFDTKKTFIAPRKLEVYSEDEAMHKEFIQNIPNNLWEKV